MREFSSVYKKHAAAINKVVGGTIDFIALRGHVFRYQEPTEYTNWDKKWNALYNEDLPMIPSVWKIRSINMAKDAIKALKDKLAEGYDGIIVGTDSDVEGYGIYYMVSEALGLKKYKTLRFYETALTEKDILKSFNSMEDLYTTPRHRNAMNAYIFRSHWDWLIGMNLTVAYTVRFGELIKFGSVKAPTLKIIYDNCNAIDNFVVRTTYGVKNIHTEGYESVLQNDDAKDKSYETKEDAEKLVNSLGKTATVLTYTKKTSAKKAPKLYSLSDLQIEAAKQPYGYTPDQTLAICQKLYEDHKILTYPRTSGTYLASGKIPELPNMLGAIKAIPELTPFILGITSDDINAAAADKNMINDKEVAKAAHDALVPTGQAVNWTALTKQEQDIFLLVCKRFVAHFLPLFSEEKYTMTVDCNGHVFKATGRKTINNGYYDLYKKTVQDVIIPEYKTGDIVKIEKSLVYEKKSSPPARYSMGSIIDAMKNIASQVEDPELKKVMRESEGIGTEATRANILKDLKDSGYISTTKNMIYITEAGKRYIENVRTSKMVDGKEIYDYGMADPMTVAFWSAKNKEIQLGDLKCEDVLRDFETYINNAVSTIKTSGAPIHRSKAEQAAIDLPPCPLCGNQLLFGKYGIFCSNNKEGCKISIPAEICSKKLTKNQMIGIANGRQVMVKGMKSKAGKSFDAGLKLNQDTGRTEFVFENKKN